MLKRLSAFAATLLLSLSSLLVLVPATVHGAADTCTWTGTAGDHQFSTAGNWTGCDNSTVPENGDSLTFPVSATDKAPDNDMSSMSFATITFNGTGSSGFDIDGNSFTVTSGITDASGQFNFISNDLVLSGAQAMSIGSNAYVGLNGVVSGSGAITKTGAGTLALRGANSAYSGAITVSAGALHASDPAALGTAGAGTTVSNGAELVMTTCDPTLTLAEPLTLSGASANPTGDSATAKLTIGAKLQCLGGGGADEVFGHQGNDGTVTLSGNITLGSDVTFAGYSATTTITGTVSGGFSFTSLPGYSSSLVIGDTTIEPVVFTKTLSDAQPLKVVSINGSSVITIDGTRGSTIVNSGGILKGTGTIAILDINSGGTVAPGHSPGCLNSGNFTLAGTYEAELGGTDACTGYDQMKVTGTVVLTGGTLDVSLYNDFKPAKGQKYMIIDNDAADAVTGTFTGLAEGATVTSGEYSFKISYAGGDGNDVVLSVIGVPDTGFQLLTSNPIITLLSTTLLALSIALIARRYNKVLSR